MSGRPAANQCTVPGCDTAAIARGLCRKHYSRQRRGAELADDRLPAPAFGQLGVLDDDGDTVMCHVCGRRLRALAAHAVTVHGLTAREYKLRHGLPLTRGLVSEGLSARLRQRAVEQIGSPAWQRLEAKRDPVAAAHSRDEDAYHTPARRDAGQRAAAGMSAANRSTEAVKCRDCGVEMERRPGKRPRVLCEECLRRQMARTAARTHARKREDAATRDAKIVELWRRGGMSKSAIGREVGVTNVTVLNVLRRHGAVA